MEDVADWLMMFMAKEIMWDWSSYLIITTKRNWQRRHCAEIKKRRRTVSPRIQPPLVRRASAFPDAFFAGTRKRSLMVNRLILIAALSLAWSGAPAEFCIATDGSDANPGTRAKPFATLERARDAIRELKQNGALPKNGVT